MADKIRITIDVSQEQLETIESLFMHFDWDYIESRRQIISTQNSETSMVKDSCTQTSANGEGLVSGVLEVNRFHIPQNENEEECTSIYRYCRPCK